MDIQFYGANCISLNFKTTRIVIDDNLAELGKKQIIKTGDIALYTTTQGTSMHTEPKIVIDCAGEYEVADISIVGIPAKSHIDNSILGTMYKITTNDFDLLVTGHIDPKLSDKQLEAIGMPDVVVLPVGGHGYTLDAKGALSVIKEIEPKLVIPTHYEISGINYEVPQAPLIEALKELGMEPKETIQKLRLKPADLTDVTQLIVLEVS